MKTHTNGNGHARHANEIIWPIGRFAGQHLSQLSGGYLEFALKTLDGLSPAMKADLKDELRRRQEARQPPPPPFAETVRRWRRILERHYEGNPGALKIVARAHKVLKQLMGD